MQAADLVPLLQFDHHPSVARDNPYPTRRYGVIPKLSLTGAARAGERPVRCRRQPVTATRWPLLTDFVLQPRSGRHAGSKHI